MATPSVLQEMTALQLTRPGAHDPAAAVASWRAHLRARELAA
jgi:hypothetical protein